MADDIYADSSGIFAPAGTAGRRRMFEAMMQQGMQGGPVAHWTQGLGRLAKAMIGGYGAYRADEDEREAWDKLGITLGNSLPPPNLSSVGKVGTDAPSAPSAPAPTAGLDMSQPRSVRTNNPGAINFGPFAQAAGATGSDGRLAIFPDAATGTGAMDRLLGIYGRHGQNTIATIIGGLPGNASRPGWAPRGVDNNSTDAYIASVARATGLDPNAPIPAEMMPRVRDAMAAYEAGRPVAASAGGARPQVQGWIGGPESETAAGASGALRMAPPPTPGRWDWMLQTPVPNLPATGKVGTADQNQELPNTLPGEDVAVGLQPRSAALPGSGGADPMMGPGGGPLPGPQPLRGTPQPRNRAGVPMTGAASDLVPRTTGAVRSGWRPPAAAAGPGAMDRFLAWMRSGLRDDSDPGGDPFAGDWSVAAAEPAAPAANAPAPATAANQPLGTPTAVPGITMGQPGQPTPPGSPEAPPAAPPPATRPPAAMQAMSANDVIRQLLMSRNPQAIQFAVQLYRDTLRRGPTADFDFQASEGSLYRVNKRTGEAQLVAGTGQGKVPEAIRTQGIKADQAYRNLSTALDDYERLVTRTGITALPGQDRDAVTQARTNIQLQLKELYNLGVLNGPDLELMNKMLPDTDISVGNVWSNPSGRVGPAVARLREMLRTLRNNQTSAIGMSPIQPGQPQGGGEGYRVLGVR